MAGMNTQQFGQLDVHLLRPLDVPPANSPQINVVALCQNKFGRRTAIST
jgi:hypothetical protein